MGEFDDEEGGDEHFAVLPENEDALLVFLALVTQWRRDWVSGQVQGVDYQAITPVMQLLNITSTPRMFDDLRAMELAALDILNADR